MTFFSESTMFENLEDDNASDDASEPLEELADDLSRAVSRIVSTSYETVDDGPDSAPRDRTATNTRSDRWAATAAHVRKRIQSTKRHTKGAIQKKYKEITTKRERSDKPQRPGGVAQPVYGVPLQVAVQRSVLNHGIQLPTVVRHCIDHLEEYLDHRGMYRLSGQKSKIEAIKTAYDNGEDIDLADYTPDEVAGALKLFLRELPSNVLDPVVQDVDHVVTNTELDIATRCIKVREIVDVHLEPCNFALISWLCIHISHIIDQAEVNKMSAANIVIVFSPTLELSQPTLTFLFTHTAAVFKGVELRRYVVPSLDDTQLFQLPELNCMDPAELTWQLIKTEDLLTQLHRDLHILTESEKESKADMIWSYQRQVTDIKRLLRTRAKSILKISAGDDHSNRRPSEAHDFAGLEDWESLQNVVLDTLKVEIQKLIAMEKDTRSRIQQEEEWTTMVQEQIDALPPVPDEGPGTEEDMATLSQLQSEAEQWEAANEQLISDVALESEQTIRLEARISVLEDKQ